jgi:hypothetical protein
MSAGNRPQRVMLELESCPDPIHGTLEHGDGTRERFWGWLELMAALQRLTTTAQDRPTALAPQRRDQM